MVTELRYRLLGHMEVFRGTTPVPLTAGKLRVLLATLLLGANRTVPFDTLVDRLWGENPPPSARNTVHVYTMRLRRVLGEGPDGAPLVRTRPNGYALEITPRQLDVTAFHELLERARAAHTTGAAVEESALLSEALALWQGPALLDVPSESLQRGAATRLTDERLHALERRAEVELRLGRHAEIVGELDALTREHPLRERLWAALMLALTRSGRTGEALAAYRRVRGLFRDEMGIDPGEHVDRVHQLILTGNAAPGRAEAGGPRAQRGPWEVTPCQLPPAPRCFVGRTGPVRTLTRLLTSPAHGRRGSPGGAGEAMPVGIVTGQPGVGKTTLALHVAHAVRARFPDGQLYVNLQGHCRAAPLAPAVALGRCLRALGLPAHQVPADEEERAGLYRSLLADRRVLVLLDDAAEPRQVRPLLPGGPGCAVIVTSRDDLRGLAAIEGGHRIRLTTMTDEESVALLTGLLGPARADAEPGAVRALAAECAWLPLALRIAAANVDALPRTPVARYVDVLRSRGRLAQLVSPGDEGAAVRAAFDLSYRRLSEPAATLFARLSLLPGPDFAGPAAGVLMDRSPAGAAPLLDTLVSANLVSAGGGGRYRVHDLLGEYAAARAEGDAGAPAARARLFDFYLTTARAATALLHPRPRGPSHPPAPGTGCPGPRDEAEALDWLDGELPSLVASARRALDLGRLDHAWRLADALRGYFTSRGHGAEGLAVCDAALVAARRAGNERAEASVLGLLGDIHFLLSGYEEADRCHSRSLAISRRTGDVSGQAGSLFSLGLANVHLGRPGHSIRYQEEALSLARRAGDVDAQALTLHHIGVAELLSARPGLGLRRQEQALALSRRTGNGATLCQALSGTGIVAWFQGDLAAALAAFSECLELARRLGNPHLENNALSHLSGTRCDAGDYEQAATDAGQAISLSRWTGERVHEAAALEALATVRRCTGDTTAALTDYHRALSLARELHFGYGEVRVLTSLIEAYRADGRPARALHYGRQALGRIRATGLLLSRTRAFAGIAHAHLDLGDRPRAVRYAGRALELARRHGQRLVMARSLYVYGLTQQALHGPEAALPHWRAALAVFEELGVPERRRLGELVAA
ncbi:AfsR/SARP family transcriptional regulator [Streptomyces eurocidicus]|uniref:DNA-binding SARP family transcriptional activator n=2 Tax=Streptomyces eurocidicus TaxID=66423 RepID=A0A7W8BG18_STREU|nr:BTAD domain-containing putative transcriptional regulator [Streptomyces eurocidicus]MBB5121646.1 DNA-binding SARP family transcriptional activator [Streptomyces eurocidicus]MBF6052875.1 tetratricopeptide repeat protein [Streptomyces eurocidicus]